MLKKLTNSPQRYTTDIFIEKASFKHNHKYDYSNVVYINSSHKVEIICKIHGSFLQRPPDHLFGHGCSKCNGNHNLTHDEFILKSTEIHHSFYDYTDTLFVNGKTKIKIICPIHGIFHQNPLHHITGSGCQQCGYVKQNKTKIGKGIVIDPTLKDAFELYRYEVRKLSDENYIKYYYDINPTNLRRGSEFHLDHKISIMSGFINNIPISEIASPNNLQIIPALENISKGVNNIEISLDIDLDNPITQPLTILAFEEKRLKISNTYKIENIDTKEIEIVKSIGDWCKEKGFSVSSARWSANYSKSSFMEKFIIRNYKPLYDNLLPST